MHNIDSILDFNDNDLLGRTGERIIADRYLQKGGELKVGAIAVVILEVEIFGEKTDVYEVARVREIIEDKEEVLVELSDKTLKSVPKSKVDVLVETAPRQMWRRIARGVTNHLGEKKQYFEDAFSEELLSIFKYIPGGRINASMGTGAKTTSYNCFVIPNVGPTPRDYAKSFGKTLEIQARSGGVGMNLSWIPSQGTIVPVEEVKRSNTQLVLDIWHPDVYDFVNEANIKRIKNPFKNSTKVIRISDEFEKAIENNEDWTFEFPDTKSEEYDTIWNGNLEDWKSQGLPTNTYNTVSAIELYNLLIEKGVVITKKLLGTEVISPGDSRGRIAEALAEVWENLIDKKRVSVELSSLRPRLARVVGVNGRSSGAHSWGVLYDRANWAYSQGFGPVAIAEIMSTGCLLILQGGSRRGALMIVLNDWHRDIRKFITAKQNQELILGANISVGISDKFMELKDEEKDNWSLGYVKPEEFHKYEKMYFVEQEDFVEQEKVSAKVIWEEIMSSAWKSAEPGVIFMERYNKMSNSFYYNPIIATNPCGE